MSHNKRLCHIQSCTVFDQPDLGQSRTGHLTRWQRVLIDLTVEPLHHRRIQLPCQSGQSGLKLRETNQSIGADKRRCLVDREEIQIVLE